MKGRAEGNALGLKLKCCSSVRAEDGTTRSREILFSLCVVFYDCECKLPLPFVREPYQTRQHGAE